LSHRGRLRTSAVIRLIWRLKISQGVVVGIGDKSAAAAGMALVSAMLILIGGRVCPLIVFVMMAFVDPGTSSGSARTSFAAAGGVGALLGCRGGGAEVGGSGRDPPGRRWPLYR